MANDFAFEMAAPAVRFGAGGTREEGADLEELAVKRAGVLGAWGLRGLTR